MVPRITRLSVVNYKSIAATETDLEPFTVFVGPNGSGKSNLIDALSFVCDSLSRPINDAFLRRGGIRATSRYSWGHPTNIGIRLTLSLADGMHADYSFNVAAEQGEAFRVARERCVVVSGVARSHRFEVRNGKFVQEIPGIRPKVEADRLALYAASGTAEFRPVYDFLTSMRFYSVVPDRIRELQAPDSGESLAPDGANAAAVLRRVKSEPGGKERYDRICRLLSKVVEGVTRAEPKTVGGRMETVRFTHEVGAKRPWTLEALSMSDGTLRVLGLLLAVYQAGRHSVIAIEEPEATVHPGAAELVVQVLMDAAHERQVLVTTHSPDVLDYKGLDDSQVRIVTKQENWTLVSSVSDSTRETILQRLYSPGELLRVGELNPDLAAAKRRAGQIDLFGRVGPEQAGLLRGEK
ncbi:MAG: AAA family ATPase [Verrucomicrobia bacterium]|nr:AAA family ATPase [Verrucomicrobiota bacterium]